MKEAETWQQREEKVADGPSAPLLKEEVDTSEESAWRQTDSIQEKVKLSHQTFRKD